jgi:hypothetical protein
MSKVNNNEGAQSEENALAILSSSDAGQHTKEIPYEEVKGDGKPPVLEIKGQQARYLRYDFTAVEKDKLSDLLANKVQELESIKMSKKSAMASYKAQEDTMSQEISELATKVSNNYEYRDTVCEVIYNQPRRGVKTFIRSDTGTIFTEEMNDADYAFVAKAKEPKQTSFFDDQNEY